MVEYLGWFRKVAIVIMCACTLGCAALEAFGKYLGMVGMTGSYLGSM